MQAVVLVGGEGTRLRPLTLTRPKPALRLVDRPFIRFMVDWLAAHGVDEVIMACGFRAELLREALGDGGEGGPPIRYVEEPEPLGTGGPLRLAAEEVGLDGRFLALNGDVLTDLDLTALIEAHEAAGAAATLALHPVADPSSYGLVLTGADGAVEAFVEKPDPGEISTDEISAGAYVLEPGVLDLIPPGRACSIERQVFPRLVGEGLYGQRLEGYWMDIGTPERYLQASWDILECRVATDVPAEPGGAATLIEDGCEVATDATVGPRAVLGADSRVGAGARVMGSVLDSGCTIGDGATVDGAILGRGVEVGAGARIAAGAVIGDGARVKASSQVAGDARVAPGEVAG
ncbi:MAG: sugar phosphate nucleotidyltransferase [Solirubrobacterales bacterium]